MKISSRIFAIVMAIVLIFSAMPATIFAEETQTQFYIKDTYVFEPMRDEEGDFLEVYVSIIETGENDELYNEYTETLRLNGTAETSVGAVTCTDDQRTTAWEVGGIYPVTYNGGQTFQVEVLPNPITYMDMNDCLAFFDEEQGSYVFSPYTLFEYSNGSGISSYVDRTIWLNADEFYSTNYGFSFEIAVGYEFEVEMSEWVLGNSYAVTASFFGFTDTFNVTPMEVQSISVGALQSVEGENTYNNIHTDENGNRIEWRAYDADPKDITICFSDGSSISGDREQIFEQTGIWPGYTTDQSYENQWGMGDHTVTLTFLNAGTTYTYTVLENPIASIYVEPLRITEDLTLNETGYWDGDAYIDEPWHQYSLEPTYMVIYFKDETSVSGTPNEIYDQTGIWPEFYSNTTPWGIGEHTATVRYNGFSSTYTVIIEESPIVDITIEPVELLEKIDVTQSSDNDENGFPVTWYAYAIVPDFITIHYKDGSEVSGTQEEIAEQTGIWYSCSSDESYENQWSVGEHTATLNFNGFEKDYTVKILECPISHISVEDMEIMEYTNGETTNDGYWDENGNYIITDSWFIYHVVPDYITVHLKDGSSVSGNEYFEAAGHWPGLESDQSYENQWDVGTHTATLRYGSLITNYTVTILESPIASIVIDPILLTEKINGYITYDRYWHDMENYTDYYYFQYYVEPPYITINYKDGTSISGTQQEIGEMTGIWPSCYSEEGQNYQNQWGVGDHTCIIDFNGARSTYTVTVQECPIEKVTVEPVLRTEQFDAIHNSEYWDEETETTIQASWISYEYGAEAITLHYKDGTTFTGDPSEIEERLGIWPSCNSDQSYHNQWGVGDHTATLTLGGFEVEYPVTIQACPIDRFEVAPISLIEGMDGNMEEGYWDENNNFIEQRWFYYYVDPTEITVYFKDGRPAFTGTRSDIENQLGFWPEILTDQSYHNQWGVGDHTATLSFGAFRCEFTVSIEEYPIKGISAETVQCIVGLSGWTDNSGYWDENGNYIPGPEWFRYEITPQKITVHYSDGTTFTGTQDQVAVETGYWPNVTDDQSYENQWGIGEHTAIISLGGGLSAEYTVEVIENPIERIDIPDFTRLELFDGERMDEYWDEETGLLIPSWFGYDVIPSEMTVYFKDGSHLTGTMDDLYHHLGVWPQFDNDQGPYNQWEVGDHEVTLRWGEAEATYTITVVENNVSHITVDNAECYENEDGYLAEEGYWNEYGEFIVTDTWHRYNDFAPATITVHYQDGTSTTYDYDEIGDFTGYWPYCMDDQSYENQWGVGEHTAYLCYGGYKAAFTVTVKEFVMTDDHEHTYRDDCDATCVCGYTRTAPHSFSDANDIICDDCGEMKYGMDFVYTLLKHIDGLDVGLTDEEADFSGDGKITVFDAVRLLQIINNTPIE